MVEVRDLRKRFGPVAAVDGVSFVAADVGRDWKRQGLGQITGLLGENGAGKSTTLAMIGGVLNADGGSVHIDGVDAGASPHGRRQLGALLDHAGMYSRLTARENIRYFGELHGLSGRGLGERIGQGPHPDGRGPAPLVGAGSFIAKSARLTIGSRVVNREPIRLVI